MDPKQDQAIQTPVVDTTPVTLPQPADSATTPQGTAPSSTPDVQVAEHATPLPPHKEQSHNGSKFVFVLIGLIVLVVLGVLGYYLLSRQNTNVTEDAIVAPTVVQEAEPTAAPTPKDEDEEADQVDVSYPTTEVDAVQTDLQGL